MLLKNKLLEEIWDKLSELISSGEIKNIIYGKDYIENPLDVFAVIDGELVESVTDNYGYPNVDDNGVIMYENTHFKTKQEAIKAGIKDNQCGIKYMLEIVSEKQKDLQKAENRLEIYKERFQKLNSQLNAKTK